MKTLSIFADESGRFQYPDSESRFYILSLVLHDQAKDISRLVGEFDAEIEKLSLSNLCFHAGPIIRQEKGYAFMNRQLRSRVFFRMLAFAHKADFRYHSFVVDKRYITMSEQIVERLRQQMREFLDERADILDGFDEIKIYYDCR